MIAGFGGEGGEVVPVEIDAIEMREVGIVAGFTADGGEPDAARCGIDAQDLGDAAVAGGDLVPELADAKVVEVEMAPVVALRVPEEFTGLGKVVPVDAALTGFELGGGLLFVDVSDFAGSGVSEAQFLVFVIAGSGDESERFRVRSPLDVFPARRVVEPHAAGDVVAEGGAVLVGRHFEADDGAGIRVDDDALDHGDGVIAGKRIFPLMQDRVADFCLDQVHVADVALVLLKGGNLFRVGRPEDDGAITRNPAGVVGSVAEVFDAVVGELRFMASSDVAEPKIPVADEDGALAIGGERLGRSDVGLGGVERRAGCAGAIAEVALGAEGDGDGAHVWGKIDGGKRQMLWVEGTTGEGAERRGKFLVIESGLLGAGGGINEDEFRSAG